MRRSLCLLSILALASCAPPGRQIFASAPKAAEAADLKAATAFADRLALVSVQPGTRNLQPALKHAVDAALAIKPDARFEIQAESPATGDPDKDVQALNALTPEAQAVAAAIIADGVSADRITLGAKAAGQTSVILVYVK